MPLGGFDAGARVGGALVPLVVRVNVGGLGFVSGFGAGAAVILAPLVAVRVGCNGRLGLLAPIAATFRGCWDSTKSLSSSSSSSMMALRLRLRVVDGMVGPRFVLSVAGDELRSLGKRDIC